MRVPIKIKLLRWVKIAYPDAVIDEQGAPLYGRTIVGNRRVEVAKDRHSGAEDLHATTLHEVLHLALSVSGHSEWLGEEREEALVTALENYLAPVLCFRENSVVSWGEVDFPWEE